MGWSKLSGMCVAKTRSRDPELKYPRRGVKRKDLAYARSLLGVKTLYVSSITSNSSIC